jgi:hypothetical protein
MMASMYTNTRLNGRGRIFIISETTKEVKDSKYGNRYGKRISFLKTTTTIQSRWDITFGESRRTLNCGLSKGTYLFIEL